MYDRKKPSSESAITYISKLHFVYCMLFWNYVFSFLMKNFYLFLLSFIGIYMSQMWIRLYWRSNRWFQVLYKLMNKSGFLLLKLFSLTINWMNLFYNLLYEKRGRNHTCTSTGVHICTHMRGQKNGREKEKKRENLESNVIVWWDTLLLIVLFLGNLYTHIRVNMVSFHLFSQTLGFS